METLCGRLTEKTLRTFLQVIPSRHLTLAVSGRRPDATFQVHSKPPAGGGHEHGFVRPSSSLQQGPFSQTFHLLKDFFGLTHQVLDNLPCGFDIVY
jgi:hypothetical protein